nr:MAG TPA: hypothetical protein [Bacteriophage sp.]
MRSFTLSSLKAGLPKIPNGRRMKKWWISSLSSFPNLWKRSKTLTRFEGAINE